MSALKPVRRDFLKQAAALASVRSAKAQIHRVRVDGGLAARSQCKQPEPPPRQDSLREQDLIAYASHLGVSAETIQQHRYARISNEASVEAIA